MERVSEALHGQEMYHVCSQEEKRKARKQYLYWLRIFQNREIKPWIQKAQKTPQVKCKENHTLRHVVKLLKTKDKGKILKAWVGRGHYLQRRNNKARRQITFLKC